MTNVGISLHKQGQVLDHFVRTEKPKILSPQGKNKEMNCHWSISLSVSESIKTHHNRRTQELLNKKRRLQAILHELKLLAKAKQSIQPTLDLQEKILS